MELQGYSSGFTERVGYIVYGAYNFATVIVLLNMLIAMMSRTFGKIKVDNMSTVLGTVQANCFSLFCVAGNEWKLVHWYVSQ